MAVFTERGTLGDDLHVSALSTGVVAHYVELFQHWGGNFDQAACVTVVPGGRELDDIVDTLGVVVRRAGPMDGEGFGEASWARWDDEGPTDALVWVVQDGSTLALLEANGFAGSTSEVLRPLSWGGHLVASMLWIDANGANSIAVARDGDVESCNADFGDDDDLARCPTLAPYLPEVWDLTDDGWPGYRAGGLAALEEITGFRLTRDHLAASWPAVWFRPRPVTPVPPPGILGSVDPELALALLNASPVAYRLAGRDLAAEVARAVGVADVPAVRALIDGLNAGDTALIDHDGLQAAARGWQDAFRGEVADPADPAWQRFVAGRVFTGLAFEHTDASIVTTQTPYSWFDARSALGEAWGSFRRRTLAKLTG